MDPQSPGSVKRDYPRRVLETMTTSVLVLDRQLRLVYMNPAAEMLFAASSRLTRGTPFHKLAGGTAGLEAGMRRCLESGHPYTERELPLQLPGAQLITVDCTVTPLGDGSTSATELLVELRQVDRLLKISRDEQLLAQQHTSRLLVRNLAHEIKNPLGGIRGAAQLLEQEYDEPALKEYTRIIIGEADRLRGLVDRMLGPNQPPRLRSLNIHELLERVRGLVQVEAGPGLTVVRDYDPSIPPLRGDPDQLIQALLNIMRNAAQALDNRGTITLRTRVQRQFTIGHKRHKLVVKLEIIDDGPGIPEELREEIFYPMISGRADGSGLGLPIAQALVSQHGGLIECQSRPGETVFTLYLPLENTDG
ncbi:MAG TPA: nitrogen regulation protein NR(II) [Candidatus Competibacteraceae bacterium]|nr:nitrogen regulation protein NR(II) [Candidatus Competibacteraceae bacterium]